jgi:hypothetical protein
MNPPTHDPSIGTAFGRAVETVRTLLFRPFDAGRWIAIGFCAWLALLGEGGLGGNYNFGNQSNAQKSFQFDEAKRFLLENLYWILPVTILVLLLVAALAIALLWLSSRGRFLFLHSVARNSTAVEGPWREYAREANSHFLLRLGLGAAGMVSILPLAVLAGFVAFQTFGHGSVAVPGAILLGFLVLAMIGIGTLFGLVQFLVREFVLPLQFQRRSGAWAACRECLGLVGARPGIFLLYLICWIALNMVEVAVLLIVVLATCCIAGCLFVIPFVGTVLLLPLHVFDRAVSLHLLAQFGPQYDVFRPESGTSV